MGLWPPGHWDTIGSGGLLPAIRETLAPLLLSLLSPSLSPLHGTALI
jgi:hypothetical protein